MIKKLLPTMNKLFIVISSVICIIYMYHYFLNKEYLMVSGAFMVLFLNFMPFLVERNFKINISSQLKVSYFFYVFITGSLGMVANLYHYVNYYDKVAHFFSGVYISWIFILGYKHIYKKINTPIILFITILISFNSALALFWEFIEYTMDIILGTRFQKGLSDTMEDAFLAVIGGLIVALVYIFKYKKKSID